MENLTGGIQTMGGLALYGGTSIIWSQVFRLKMCAGWSKLFDVLHPSSLVTPTAHVSCTRLHPPTPPPPLMCYVTDLSY